LKNIVRFEMLRLKSEMKTLILLTSISRSIKSYHLTVSILRNCQEIVRNQQSILRYIECRRLSDLAQSKITSVQLVPN